MPPILSTSHCEFSGARSLHSFTCLNKYSTFIVSRIVDPHLIAILFTSSLIWFINHFLPLKHFYAHIVFLFLVSSFSSHNFFLGLHEPKRFFKFSCLSNISHFLTDFSKTCVSTSPMYAAMYALPCHTISFQPEKNT